MAKLEVKAAEEKVKAAEEKVKVAKLEVKAAEEKLEKLRAAGADDDRDRAKRVLNIALEGLEIAQAGVKIAQAGVTSAQKLVDAFTEAVLKAGAYYACLF